MTAGDRATRAVAGALVVSVTGSVVFLVAAWTDGGTQVMGTALGVALAGLAAAAGLWGTGVGTGRVALEHREAMPSPEPERQGAASAFRVDAEPTGASRRGVLGLLGLAGAALAAAVATPLRSLGPRPYPALEHTAWRAGRRLVDSEGRRIRAGDLDVDSVVTVFPDGAPSSAAADSQVVLIRMRSEHLRLPRGRESWTPQGHVAYSKVCTHAGCPVGLYEARTRELLCPCHQSVFRADAGATVSFGPAARPLPQLPLGIDDEGYLIATADFDEPVGPSYWSRP